MVTTLCTFNHLLNFHRKSPKISFALIMKVKKWLHRCWLQVLVMETVVGDCAILVTDLLVILFFEHEACLTTFSNVTNKQKVSPRKSTTKTGYQHYSNSKTRGSINARHTLEYT